METGGCQLQVCLTSWINHQLRPRQKIVTDLLYDLRSGDLLLDLVNSLHHGDQLVQVQDTGGLSMAKMANITTVLSHLQRERVKLDTDLVTAQLLIEGHKEATIHLVWAIAFHYETRAALGSIRLPSQLSSPNMEVILMAWVTQVCPLVSNLTSDFADGQVLAKLVLSSKPSMIGLTSLTENSSSSSDISGRIVSIINEQLNLPPLLQFLPQIPDKKVTILYLLCLAKTLGPNITAEMITGVKIEENSEFSTSPSGSPMRNVEKVSSASNMTGWTNVLEEVLSWLLEAEDHLMSLNSLGQKHLETVKSRFYNHEDFMLELKSHQNAVGEVLTKGRQLLTSDVSPDESKDIRLQMKVLNERWEKVRQLAMNKQTELHRLVMKLQMEQMTELKTWMSEAENKLSMIQESDFNQDKVSKELAELNSLLGDLEKQQSVVSSISNFILVEVEDPGLGSLEDELSALGERWVTLCNMCEQKHDQLQILETLWSQFRDEETGLVFWMDSVENKLKTMEIVEDLDKEQLADQGSQVTDIERSFVDFEKKLIHMTDIGQELQDRLNNEDENAVGVVDKIEMLQDRWDVLVEILEAQKLRISRLGVQLEKVTGLRTKKEREITLDDQIAVKKRKVTNSSRISTVEDSFLRINEWAEHIIKRLEDGIVSLELVDKQLLLEETEAEVKTQQEKILVLIKEGETLINDLATEPEPESSIYLGPEAVSRLRSQTRSCQDLNNNINSSISNLRINIEYQLDKKKFHQLTWDISTSLDKLQKYSEQNIFESIDECELQFQTLINLEKDIEEVKQLASSLSLHKGASSDPGNKIKSDCYSVCDRFSQIEEKLTLISSQLKSSQKFSKCNEESGSVFSEQQNIPKEDSDEVSEKSVSEESTVTVTETVYQSPVTSSGDAGQTYSVERSEVYLVIHNPEEEVNEDNMNREQSKLESDLIKCSNLLSSVLFLHDSQIMNDLKEEINEHFHLFDEAFVPAYFTEEESTEIVEKMKKTKTDLKNRENELDSLATTFNQWKDELQGLSLWMKEVEVFLHAEEAAIGDIDTLEAQVKESDALQDDIRTLQPNMDQINETGNTLINRCDKTEDEFSNDLQNKLSNLNSDWDATVASALEQNSKLRTALDKSKEVVTLISDINVFLDQLETDLASTESSPVTAAPELSQRTFKLMQLREKTDQKSEAFHRLSTFDVGSAASKVEAQIQAIQDRWSEVTGPVHHNYGKMKEATTDYGEFRTLVAQETDWLDRLEKKLRRSSKCAADAEEISEELDDLENCLNNHPLERLERLQLLASSLSNKDILISPVSSEADALTKKWQDLEGAARLRIKSLETCIMEAQEWECKILAVQDWLHEKDLLLTSHLEHELTVDDLHDEAQLMLREFEDKENLLAEMEGQVDAYREAGKEEAAARLEDQLSLIHTKFQELSGKFELFQRPSDYDGRLGRITRQLVDLQSNMYLTELISHEPEAIQGHLHHTRCIYNALANIKPEVEATIKMGRKLVETQSVAEPEKTTKNIDHLKELFNLLGAQVTEAKSNLEKALSISETLTCLLSDIFSWLEDTEELLANDRDNQNINSKVAEMKIMKLKVRELLSVKTEFIGLCGDPTLLSGLKEILSGLEAKWSEVKVMVEDVAASASGEHKVDLKDLSLDSDEGERIESPVANSSTEESFLLHEFREAFQEICRWLEETEKRLDSGENISEFEDELQNVRPKIDNLGNMAMKIVEKFANQSVDVEPEIELLLNRWKNIVKKIEGKREANGNNVKVSGASTNVINDDEIVTLPEESSATQSTPLKRSFPIDSFVNFKAAELDTTHSKIPRPTFSPPSSTSSSGMSKEKKIPPPTLPKPRWYVESMQMQSTSSSTPSASSIPVKQVVVTSSTLPSPCPLTAPSSSKTEPSPSKCPEVTTIPASPGLDDETLDKQLARDHADIDKLFSGSCPNDVPEDVKTRGNIRVSSGQNKDIKQFLDTCDAVDIKMGQVKVRMEQISSESDLGLRSDLVEMETQQIEAEVATSISRGETLILMIHRQDPTQAENLQARVNHLRDNWQTVKRSADTKKHEAESLRLELEKFLSLSSSLSTWLEETKRKIESVKGDKKELGVIGRQMEAKKADLTTINKIGNKLTAANAFKGQEASLTSLNQKWEQAKQSCSLVTRRDHSKSASPKESVNKTYPAELNNKISRVREAVSAVDKQLNTSVLTGRKYEKLSSQQETLERVKSAVDTLKPNVKKLEKDLELMSGSVSMEYFEKLTSMGEKCREEWASVNKKYQTKKKVYDEAMQDCEKLSKLELNVNEWLQVKEKLTHTLKQNNTQQGCPSNQIDTLHRELLDWQQELNQFISLSQKISSASDASFSKKIVDTTDSLDKRYKCLVREVTNIMNENSVNNNEETKDFGKNLNTAVTWAEETLSLITKQVNVSDLSQLGDIIDKLESAQAEAINQRIVLDQFASHVGVNNEAYQQSRGKVERIVQMLPKRLGFLIDRRNKINKLMDNIKSCLSFLEEIKLRKSKAKSPQESVKLRLAVTDKEYDMNRLFNDFLILEREVTGSGLNMEEKLGQQIKFLKENWYSLAADVRKVSNNLNGNPEASPTRIVPVEVSSPAESMYSLGSPSTTSTSQDMIASPTPTTQSTSPMSEEVVSGQDSNHNNLIAKCKQIVGWLNNLVVDVDRAKVRVDKCEAVARELDKYRNLLHQLEAKKQQMEDIIASATSIHGDSEDVVNQINVLKAEWKKVHQTLLGRKTELTAMLEHSDNFDSKGREVSDWLGKLERQLAGATVGKTRDVLLAQIREVNQVMRELQKYSHHVTLFTQMCQRLVSIYARDITDGIQQLAGELTGRYAGLTSSCSARAKTLTSSLENLNMFDRELAEFLAWLGEMETSLERMDAEQSPNVVRLKDVQEEVRTRDRQFSSLTSRGKDQLAAAGDSDIVLGSKVGELGRRWSLLQNMIMGIQDRCDTEGDNVKLRIEDFLQWIITKRTEVDSVVVAQNLNQINRQKEEHCDFRSKIETRNTDFMNILQEAKVKNMNSSKLEQEWNDLIAVTENLTKELELAETALRQLDVTLTDLDKRLCKVESDQSSWTQSPQHESLESEMYALELVSNELKRLEEDVLKSKIALDSSHSISQPSMQKLATIERRLTTAQESVVTRKEQLKSLDVVPDPASQNFLASSVPEGWERGLTEDMVPFFSCHQSETTQWDHPEFVAMLETVSAMNTVKFSAYRMALKLRKVQQKLCLDLLDIASAVVCFDSHGLTSDKDDLTICVPEMVTILTSIYETLYQCEPEDINVSVCVDLALNWILNVYDSQRQGFVRVLSFKLSIILLCRGPLTEKYSVMFSVTAGTEQKLDQRRLGLLLYDLMMVPRYLGEVAQFGGTNIEPSVRSCLSVGATEPRTSVDCSQFIKWLQEEPQCTVWLPVLHRLASAETATHDVKCKICKVDPIVGFRYHCRKCFNLDICHACFFVGKTYKGCKPGHPMQEYCTSTTKTDNAKHILQAVRNSFRSKKYFKKKHAKLGYLPVQSVMEGESFESPMLSPNLSFESREFVTSDSVGGSGAVSGKADTEDDEHSLIAAYCKLLTGNNNNNIPSTASILFDVDQRVDNMEKEAVEQQLEQLKEENLRLENEYKQLLDGQNRNSQSGEEKTLIQQRTRLEARMAILEDHNRQLEAQLERLRQLVHSEGCPPTSPTASGLQTKYVVAADLHNEAVEAEPVQERPKPPAMTTRNSLHVVSDRSSGSFRDSGTSDGENRLSATSGSLNLSQHNTETVQDDDED